MLLQGQVDLRPAEISLFLRPPLVKLIYFNDAKVREVCGPLVKPWRDHDDHLHIGLWERP